MIPSVSFIVPALNEEENIEATVDAIIAAVDASHVKEFEIVLVNDGSFDKTGQVMHAISARNSVIRVLDNHTNLGVGASFLKAVSQRYCEYVMLVAGDNVASVSSISNTISNLGSADIFLPYISNPEIRPIFRRMGSRAFTKLINLLFGLHIKYYQGAVLRRILLNEITVSSTGYVFFAEIVVKLIKNGATYEQGGIKHTKAPHNNSSALKIKNLLCVIKEILNFYVDIKK